MSGMMKRKCCGSGCSPLNCSTWCSCLPNDITLTFELTQKWEKYVNGQKSDFGNAVLSGTNIKMTKYQDAQSCFLYSKGVVNGVPNGVWNYTEYTETYAGPQYSFYIQPNCPGGCDVQNLAVTEDRYGNGNVDAMEIVLECYDPCQQPFGRPAAFPTNRLAIDIIGNVTTDLQCHGEWLTLYCGSNVPPYTVTEELTAEIYGKPECLQTSTFNQRTLRWYNMYGDTVPQQISYICQNPCQGECKGPYSCQIINQNGTPPYLPVYDWWSQYNVTSCKYYGCINSHSCWNGYYGNQPAVYSCDCNSPNGSGMGTIEYTHRMTSSVTITIP